MEAQVLTLSRRALDGDVSLEEVVEVIEDLNGQLDEVRSAMRVLTRHGLTDHYAAMLRAEGLLYSADLAIGMAKATIGVEVDEATAEADAEGDA